MYICQDLLFWRSDFAKHKQKQQVIKAVETAAYYKRPPEARKPEQIAREDRTCRSGKAPRKA